MIVALDLHGGGRAQAELLRDDDLRGEECAEGGRRLPSPEIRLSGAEDRIADLVAAFGAKPARRAIAGFSAGR
jgi:hypothetical protein